MSGIGKALYSLYPMEKHIVLLSKILKILLNSLSFHCVIPVYCDFLVCILTVIMISI